MRGKRDTAGVNVRAKMCVWRHVGISALPAQVEATPPNQPNMLHIHASPTLVLSSTSTHQADLLQAIPLHPTREHTQHARKGEDTNAAKGAHARNQGPSVLPLEL